ncbi:MAG: hypothetical protein GEU88_04530 [Solirubrobacterales bacterium]|nr:hypothetical protein [Solirubrobacterales bacterium]
MIAKSRLIVAAGLVLALAVSGIAFAAGADDNQASVEGKVSPKKLDKKKFKPVNLLSGVRTTGPVPGENPEREYLSYDRNIKFKSKAAPTCSAPIEFLSTEAARAACPRKSYIGKGKASIELPGGLVYNGITVSAFNGPGKNQLRLHTFDPRLAGATPTVFGKLVKSNAGRKYKWALSVPDAPDVAGDTGKITSFNAKIKRSSGIVLARCKSKQLRFERKVTYDDGSTETVTTQQKCKRKRGGKHRRHR